MTSPLDAAAHQFVRTARDVLRADPSATALTTLDWWSLLDQLDDREARVAAFALFRAHGRELATTPALGALVAAPYLAALGAEAGSAVAAISSAALHGPASDGALLVVGDVSGRRLLVDRPSSGVSIVEPEDAILHPLDLPGRLQLAVLDTRSRGVAVDPADLALVRRRSTALGRIALADEMLGAAEGAVALAVAYAGVREQFGEPIGRFQAVRHLLAWAHTDCVAIAAVVRRAVLLGDAGDEIDTGSDSVIAKALAGRNGRVACERAMQVLGGIAFTAEHDHHHHHSRVLALDGLLGTSADLTLQLGGWLRSAGNAADHTRRALAVTAW